MRKNKEIIIFDQEQYDGEWPPENAMKCLAWFSAKVEDIPQEFRSTAKIEIEGFGGYEGSAYANIKITYVRPETDEEVAERELKESNQKSQQELRERQQLAALKAKYEDKA